MFAMTEKGCTLRLTSGFCKSATRDEIAKHGFVLTPGRYVGAEDAEDDEVLFEERVAALTQKLDSEFELAKILDKRIRLALGLVKA